MSKVITALATSLDGFIAGRDDNTQQPLGRNAPGVTHRSYRVVR